MSLNTMAATYRRKTGAPAHEDARSVGRLEDERITVWKPAWIPVVALGPTGSTSGLYLDSETGCLGRWSRYNEPPAKHSTPWSPTWKRPLTCSKLWPWSPGTSPV